MNKQTGWEEWAFVMVSCAREGTPLATREQVSAETLIEIRSIALGEGRVKLAEAAHAALTD